MMKFVRAFSSMESKRVFLRSLGCLDDLLLLEEESGNILDAVELARLLGDVLKEADLLRKVGNFVEATWCVLWYVFSNSLWGNRNSGWPLTKFDQKEELCRKAMLLAKMESDAFCSVICSELEVLSDHQSSLTELKKLLHASQKHKSLRGEILSIWKILDAHLYLNSSKYDWEDELPIDLHRHCEDKISKNRVSVRTLAFYWNQWKENVLSIFQSLAILSLEEQNKQEPHFDFCLSYFGVKKHFVNTSMLYLIVNKDADWLKKVGHKGDLYRDGKILTLYGKQLMITMRSYWQFELVSVGVKVLETLRELYKLKSKGCAFHQSTSLLHIFEVSRFLLDCKYLDLTYHHRKSLQDFLKLSTTYYDLVFPLDWRRSVSEDFILFRGTDLSLNLLGEIILQNVNIIGDLAAYCTIGRVMMICLGSKMNVSLYEKMITWLQLRPSWKSFVEKLLNGGGLNNVYVAQALQNALEDTYKSNWRRPAYMSTHSFMHLLEHLLFMASSSSGTFFTSRSSFLGSFTPLHLNSTPSTMVSATNQASSEFDVSFLVEIVQKILYNKEDTVSWIQASNSNPAYYHPLVVLKLVMTLSLICLRVSDCSQVLLELLMGKNNIAYLLPKKFVFDLLRRRQGYDLNLNTDVVAEAFIRIGDPLLIVSWDISTPRINAPSAIFVNLSSSRDDILSILFQRRTTPRSQNPLNNDGCGILEAPFSNTLPDANLNVNPDDGCKGELQMNWEILKEISESINRKKGKSPTLLPVAATIKKELDKNVHTLATALEDEKSFAREDALVCEVICALDELKLISSALDKRLGWNIENTSGPKVEHSIFMNDEAKAMQEVLERLQSSRPMIDYFLKQSIMCQEVVKRFDSESSITTESREEENVYAEKKGDEHKS